MCVALGGGGGGLLVNSVKSVKSVVEVDSRHFYSQIRQHTYTCVLVA